tara:strand:+ start:977 stop:2194 length:1218 start_codon:yes stop_codon:yes gene_type:complete
MIFVAIFFVSPLKAIAAKEPVIRILIANENKVNFRADGNKLIFVNGISRKQIRTNSIRIIYGDGEVKYSINNRKGEWFDLPRNFNLIIQNNDKRGIWFKNRRYAGQLRVSLINKKIQVINFLKLEKYLKSVVSSEMPKEFPLPALQAQAIAARTYALKSLGKNKLFDVKSTQSSQVYLGIEAESSKTNKAVISTRSLALFYNEKLINAVFHSSSGGRTEDSGEVWKYQLPYLKSVVDYDQDSTNYRWSVKFKSRELMNLFPELGGVNGLQVIDKSNSNRVLKAEIYGPNGKQLISGKDLRKKLKLLSTKFDIDLKFNELDKEIKFNNINYTDNKSSLLFMNKKDDDFFFEPLPMLPKDHFLLFKGYGAGHGVGMSQWGAKGMAEKGASFRKILKHFYSGVEIKSY